MLHFNEKGKEKCTHYKDGNADFVFYNKHRKK